MLDELSPFAALVTLPPASFAPFYFALGKHLSSEASERFAFDLSYVHDERENDDADEDDADEDDKKINKRSSMRAAFEAMFEAASNVALRSECRRKFSVVERILTLCPEDSTLWNANEVSRLLVCTHYGT